MTHAPTFALVGKRVLVTGHRGMVGSALVRRLASEGCEVIVANGPRIDLRDPSEAAPLFDSTRPDVVFHAAAKVGGIAANSQNPVAFLSDNVRLATSVIDAAYAAGVTRLLYLGSSCIYPRDAAQPITEDALLTGPLEPTNQAYAVAKIAGVTLCRSYQEQYGVAFNSVMPCNLYGPGDNYHPEFSHVPAALIRRFHEAKARGASTVTIWGTGTPRREFLHVDDLADACIFAAKNWTDAGVLNIGSGVEISVADFAALIAKVVGFSGQIEFDAARPDGTPRKLLDVSRISAMGWRSHIGLEYGLRDAYRWFMKYPVVNIAAHRQETNEAPIYEFAKVRNA